MENFLTSFKDKSQRFIVWSVEFSKRLISSFTLLFFLIMISSIILCWFDKAISDTVVNQMSITFRTIVGIYLVKSTLENIFRYNDFTFAKTNQEYENGDDTKETEG
jgi:hypothetical protein